MTALYSSKPETSVVSGIRVEGNVLNNNLTSRDRARKSRTALYNDDLRLRIVEEVYKCPFLYDETSFEQQSIAKRKQTFAEIASRLQRYVSSPLKPADVAQQWKNLKDTYIKLRKKYPSKNDPDPRWRFYSVLKFIDSDDSNAFNLSNEISKMRNEYAVKDTQMSEKRLSASSSLNSSNNVEATLPSPIAIRPIVPLFGTMRTNLKPNMPTIPEPSDATTIGDAASTARTSDDEYVAFCNSLVHPLREIAEHNRFEYFALQKAIRDAIFNVQSRMHSS